MKTTKKPWIVLERRDDKGNDCGYCIWEAEPIDDNYRNPSPERSRIAIMPDGTTGQHRLNANHIVNCVNNHEKLLKEIRELKKSEKHLMECLNRKR